MSTELWIISFFALLGIISMVGTIIKISKIVKQQSKTWGLASKIIIGVVVIILLPLMIIWVTFNDFLGSFFYKPQETK